MSATKDEPKPSGVTRFLTAKAIFDANDLVTETVEIPEWGGSVIVRGLSGTERDRFEDTITDQSGKNAKLNLRNFRAKLVVLATFDNDGNRLFSEADVERLGQKSAAAIQRIFKVAQRLAGMSDEEVKELTNDLKDQSGGFGSD